jgi:hypothetical protein
MNPTGLNALVRIDRGDDGIARHAAGHLKAWCDDTGFGSASAWRGDQRRGWALRGGTVREHGAIALRHLV